MNEPDFESFYIPYSSKFCLKVYVDITLAEHFYGPTPHEARRLKVLC